MGALLNLVLDHIPLGGMHQARRLMRTALRFDDDPTPARFLICRFPTLMRELEAKMDSAGAGEQNPRSNHMQKSANEKLYNYTTSSEIFGGGKNFVLSKSDAGNRRLRFTLWHTDLAAMRNLDCKMPALAKCTFADFHQTQLDTRSRIQSTTVTANRLRSASPYSHSADDHRSC